MRTIHTLQTAVSGLTSHKSRSMLTTLGIVIGVSAIIIVMALGNGAKDLILGEFSSLGAETAVLQPGTSSDFSSTFTSHSITKKDFFALKNKSRVPNLVDAMPVIIVPGSVSRGSESYRPMIVGGVAVFFVNTFNIYPDQGTIFDNADIEANRKVAIIGKTVEEELFGSTSAVGEDINIKNSKFRVVGVFPLTGQKAFFNIDELVIIPYTTATTYITGSDNLNEIILKADSSENIDKLVYDATQTIREVHDIAPGEEDDFTVRTQKALVDQISTVVTILTAFLSAVVAISLLVGGIGIMNIMLVSVTERTKEIGLRKALGATSADILKQFLFEAVILTGIGGIIGVIFGALVALGVSVILASTVAPGWTFVFPVGAAILGVGVSAGVGLVFGIYPASQAAKKSPIEALRYE